MSGGTTQKSAFQWKSYSVSKADKAPLLDFIVRGLEARGCKVLYRGVPDFAPFYIVLETPAGERHGVLAYAFLANSRVTSNRPADEHRFQIKYGGDLKTWLEVATDSRQLVTTLFLGIDLERGIFVAADPLMNNPSPMSRSIEFKSSNVEAILQSGWAAWERERRPGKTQDRPKAELEDLRTEVLVGGRQDRLIDLIVLERLARDLDPGERHLIADRLGSTKSSARSVDHNLLGELGIEADTLFDLIEGAGRLKMAVRGWVAEQHLFDRLSKMPAVSDCRRLEEDGQPDISLRWKGGPPILVECKNTLRSTYANGVPKVDFQRTRAAKNNPCSRYYSPRDFAVLAACLHAVTEVWEFRFALTSQMTPHKSCEGRLSSSVMISEPTFTSSAELVFDKCSGLAA